MVDRLESDIREAVGKLIREDKSMLLSREDLKRILRVAESRRSSLREDVQLPEQGANVVYTDVVKSKAADGRFRSWVNDNKSGEIAEVLVDLPDSTLSRNGQGSDDSPGNRYSFAAWGAFGAAYIQSIASGIASSSVFPSTVEWTETAVWTTNLDPTTNAIRFEGTLGLYRVSFFAGAAQLTSRVNLASSLNPEDAEGTEAIWFNVLLEGENPRELFPSDQVIWSAAAVRGHLPDMSDILQRYEGQWSQVDSELNTVTTATTEGAASIFPGGPRRQDGQFRQVAVRFTVTEQDDTVTETTEELLIQPAPELPPAEEGSDVWDDEDSWLKPTPWPQWQSIAPEGASFQNIDDWAGGAEVSDENPDAEDTLDGEDEQVAAANQTQESMDAAVDIVTPVVVGVKREYSRALQPGLAADPNSYLGRLNVRIAETAEEGQPGGISFSPDVVNAMRDAVLRLDIVVSASPNDRGSNIWLDISDEKGYIYYDTILRPPSQGYLTEVIRRIFDLFTMDYVSKLGQEAGIETDVDSLYGQYLERIFDQGMIEIVIDNGRRMWLEKALSIYRTTNTVDAFSLSQEGNQAREDLQYARRELATRSLRSQNLISLLGRLSRDFGSTEAGFNELCRLATPSGKRRSERSRVARIIEDLKQYQRVLLYILDCSNPRARQAIRQLGNIEGTRSDPSQ